MQYSTVQYSTVQYSTVQYSTVQYSTAQYSTVQYSTVQYNTIQCIAFVSAWDGLQNRFFTAVSPFFKKCSFVSVDKMGKGCLDVFIHFSFKDIPMDHPNQEIK
ncbi:MAG: hypothetical protein GY679_05415 [Mycoplasma sp.]|nr:hypothetical protein [Mycoplasma sp.]